MRLLWFIAALWTLASGAWAQDDREPMVVVQGVGEVSAKPDIAHISVAVVVNDQNASTALSETSRAIRRTLRELADAGVAQADIQTSGLSLQPVYDNGRLTSGLSGPRIVGFEARNGLAVTVRDLESLGPLLDDLVRDGLNQLTNVRFDIDDAEPLLDQARRLAVADARRKAELLVDAAGVALGPLLELREGSAAGGPQRFARAEASFASDVPIARGEISLRATVTMVYQIGPN